MLRKATLLSVISAVQDETIYDEHGNISEIMESSIESGSDKEVVRDIGYEYEYDAKGAVVSGKCIDRITGEVTSTDISIEDKYDEYGNILVKRYMVDGKLAQEFIKEYDTPK